MYQKLKIRSIVLIVLLLMTVIGMSVMAAEVAEEEKYGGVLKVATEGEMGTLDLHATTVEVVENCIRDWVQEQLGTFDKNYEPRPMLAESWIAANDSKEWTIKLRKNVLFHNGKEMTAVDVKASIRRFADFSPRGGQLSNMDKIEIVDDYTVKLYFSVPFAILPTVIATPSNPLVIMPEEETKIMIGKIYNPIGTGPYKFTERKPDQYLKITRFDDYWQVDNPLPYPNSLYAGHKVAYTDEVMFYPVPEESTMMAGLKTGEFHISSTPVAPHQYESLKKDSNIETAIAKPGRMVVFYLNKRGSLFDNQYLRRAVRVGLNYEEMIKAAAGGQKDFYRTDPGLFYEEMIWHSEVGRGFYDIRDIEQAKMWMEKGNYNGEPIRLMAAKDRPYMYNTALVLNEQLKELGFNVDLQMYDWPTITDRRTNPELWDIFITGVTNMYDPYLWAEHIGAENYPGWSGNDEMRETYEKLGKISDFDERYRQMEILQSLTYIEAVMFKVGDMFNLKVQHKGVHNPNISSQRFCGINTWLEPDLR